MDCFWYILVEHASVTCILYFRRFRIRIRLSYGMDVCEDGVTMYGTNLARY